MKNVILIFYIVIQCSFAQEEITVVLSSRNNIVTKIEQNIIENVIVLYNKFNAEDSITFSTEKKLNHHDLMNRIRNISPENASKICLLGQITINDERREYFDFSSSYLPAKEVVIAQASKRYIPSDIINSNVGYIVNSHQEISIQSLKAFYTFKAIPYESQNQKLTALANDEIDFYVGDNIDTWTEVNKKIILEIEPQSGEGFGIVYPKGSKLKKKLEKYLRYYVKSTKFKTLILKYYGKEIHDYFSKELKLN